MKKLEIAAVVGIIGAIFCGNLSGFRQTVDSLREEVLRLHILAQSDSAEDQALKLMVRDELLSHAESLFSGCQTPEDFRSRALEQQETIRLLAQHVVEDQGSDAQVRVQLVQMAFDEKQYEEITMPAGVYDAVRILIGEAQGQNWWCVLYPPLCIPAGAGVKENAQTVEAFDSRTQEVLEESERFEVKFKIVEWWDRLCERFG